MKKGLFLIAIVVVAVVVYFGFFGKKNTEPAAGSTKNEKPARLAISQNPPAFNEAFSNLLNSYYKIKNDLINWDSTGAGEEAKNLAALSSQLPLTVLKGDSNLIITAKNYSGAVATESEKMAAVQTILEKRRAFSTITDNLYSLINTVRYDKDVIYYDMCPMAFNEDEQAYWLSKDSAIQNPYLGNKHPKYKGSMVTCGDVEQTIDYAPKK